MFRCLQRVRKDYMELASNDTNFLRLIPSEENDEMKRFCVEVDGPSGTPYYTGKFVVQVTLPPNYPYDPPKVKMVTSVWHPNISNGGKICVDVLQEEWYPGCSLLEILEAMRGLLSNPNPESPLNVEAAQMFINDRPTYDAITLAFSNTFANGQITDQGVEEKLSLLQAMGMTRETALVKLALHKNNVQRVIDLYCN